MPEQGCGSPATKEGFKRSLQKNTETKTRLSSLPVLAPMAVPDHRQTSPDPGDQRSEVGPRIAEFVGPLTQTWQQIASDLKRIADALQPPESPIVDTGYIAERLGCTKTWVSQQARTGLIPAECLVTGTGMGKVWKFHRDKIDRWLKSR